MSNCLASQKQYKNNLNMNSDLRRNNCHVVTAKVELNLVFCQNVRKVVESLIFFYVITAAIDDFQRKRSNCAF